LVILGFSNLANAALQNNGNGLIYDTDLNITWRQEPNNMPMTWLEANDWIDSLNSSHFGGVTDNGWSLPQTLPVNGVRNYRQTINAIEEMDISDEDRKKIYEGTARKLFRLPV
jgi:hypothetical protein